RARAGGVGDHRVQRVLERQRGLGRAGTARQPLQLRLLLGGEAARQGGVAEDLRGDVADRQVAQVAREHVGRQRILVQRLQRRGAALGRGQGAVGLVVQLLVAAAGQRGVVDQVAGGVGV